ncbi:MAG: glutaminyl-peptide cyclotransferase [Pseudomonadales bacterium]
MNNKRRHLLFWGLASVTGLLLALNIGAQSFPEQQTISILNAFKHNPQVFTQGLEIEGDRVYESSGMYGASYVRIWSLSRNKTIKLAPIDPKYFAEGLTRLNGRLYLLTWKAGRAVVMDAETLEAQAEFKYEGEGWGLTNNGEQLVMSNGTAEITFRTANTFAIERRITVTEKGEPVVLINELEWMNGYILANIWQQDTMIIIDPSDGHVVSRVDLSPMRSKLGNVMTDVINGIAWDKDSQKLYTTGKLWPKLFEVSLQTAP